jgi:hypothetical protein
LVYVTGLGDMATIPETNLPVLELTELVAPARSFGRRALGAAARTVVYLCAAGMGLAAAPLIFMFADRGTALYWANLLLDALSGR